MADFSRTVGIVTMVRFVVVIVAAEAEAAEAEAAAIGIVRGRIPRMDVARRLQGMLSPIFRLRIIMMTMMMEDLLLFFKAGQLENVQALILDVGGVAGLDNNKDDDDH